MCGIAGFWTLRPQNADERHVTAQRMADAIAHRGPDDFGVWHDDCGVTLAQRRLAVVDLSPTGAQPMHCASQRWVVTYNGEIYNHQAIRKELTRSSNVHFRGSSDTEVLIEAIDCWGLEKAIDRIEGMFAIAAWNRQEQRLHLIVDRFGEKPLYLAPVRNGVVFGSELSAVECHGDVRTSICQKALGQFARYGYVPAPATIFENIYKVPPGHRLTINSDDLRRVGQPNFVQYWNALAVAQQQSQDCLNVSKDELVDTLDGLLKRSVSDRLQADVPVGAFLSGGIDSSVIVALAQQVSSRPVRTFTIGSDSSVLSEADDARRVAQHLGTEHTEVHFGDKDLLDLIPSLPSSYSEPFADGSQLPTLLVSRIARQSVTVALSGDAGDELFGGYNRYLAAEQISRFRTNTPRVLIKSGAKLALSTSANTLDIWYSRFNALRGRANQFSGFGNKLHKLARAIEAENDSALYDQLTARWPSHRGLLRNSRLAHGQSVTGSWPPPNELSPYLHWMMGQDTVSYLPGDILTKVDRAAMAFSLEARIPFLDREVYKFAWSLAPDKKVRSGQGKWLLRQLLYKYVPQKLIDRPKAGFDVPIDAWLRGPLRNWAQDLLSDDALKRDGYFDSGAVHEVWQKHLSGKQDLVQQLWPILMFQQWQQARQ